MHNKLLPAYLGKYEIPDAIESKQTYHGTHLKQDPRASSRSFVFRPTRGRSSAHSPCVGAALLFLGVSYAPGDSRSPLCFPEVDGLFLSNMHLGKAGCRREIESSTVRTSHRLSWPVSSLEMVIAVDGDGQRAKQTGPLNGNRPVREADEATAPVLDRRRSLEEPISYCSAKSLASEVHTAREAWKRERNRHRV